MQDRYAAAAPYTHTIFALMAVAGLLALLFAARAEWRTFSRAGLGRGWWTMRLLMPLLFALGGVVVAIFAKKALGSDGLILAYLGVFVVALPLWFVLHVVVGRLLRPALDARRALWLAASPIGAALALSLIGHTLQPLAWQIGMALAG
jgi:hypothetical protein